MPKQEGQKSKLLALLHIFEQQTDEEHLLNVPQLVELLARQALAARPRVTASTPLARAWVAKACRKSWNRRSDRLFSVSIVYSCRYAVLGFIGASGRSGSWKIHME